MKALSAIAPLARRAKKRIAAVAYVSKGALDIFPFRAGDVLVVDMSKKAVSNGNTSPYEIERLHGKGVHLYNRPALHAKMFVLGAHVVVGSANLSRTSLNNDEALLCVEHSETRRTALALIKEWSGEPITPFFIERITLVQIRD